MTDDPRPSAAQALAKLRAKRPSAAEALAQLRAGDPSFADVTGGASSARSSRSFNLLAPENAQVLGDYARAQNNAESNLAEQVIQGFGANYVDDAIGLVSPTIRDQMRQQDAETGLGTKIVGQTIGAMANPLLNKGFGGGYLKSIAAGAGYGALSGSGADDENRLRGATVGGVLGGAGTAVIGGVLRFPEARRKFMTALGDKAARMMARSMGLPPSAGPMLRRALQADVAPVLEDAAESVALPGVLQGESPAIDAATQALPDAVPSVGPSVRDPWPAGPGVRDGFPRQRPPMEPQPAPPRLTSAPTPPPRLGPAAMVAELERDPAFATSRGTGGAPVPPPPSIRSPAALADAVDFRPLDTRGVAEKTGARIVAPGPYQKAAPAIRMQSERPADPIVGSALDDPDMLGQMVEMIQSGRYPMNETTLRSVAKAMEARGMSPADVPAFIERLTGRSLPGGEPVSPDMSLRKVLGDESGRLGPLYHGSPHKFDKFDLSKIGTGEGAQAYGHGLYFAENPGVARSYRSMAPDQFSVEGRTYGPNFYGDPMSVDPKHMAALMHQEHVLGKGGSIEGLLAQMRQDVGLAPEQQAVYSAAADELEAAVRRSGNPFKPDLPDVTRTRGGALYTAELPNANAEDFLDWDKPLSQQSEKVRKVIQDAWTQAGFSGVPTGTGKDAYWSLAAQRGEKPAQISDALRAAGIKGIRYLDGGSRGNGAAAAHWERVLAEGNATGEYGGLTRQQVLDKLDEAKNALSSNYVVFDDADINILHREGNTGLKMLLGMTGAGAAAAAAPKLIPKRH